MQQYRKTSITTEIHQDALKCEVEPPQPFMKPPCIYVWLSSVMKCILVKIQTTSDGFKKIKLKHITSSTVQLPRKLHDSATEISRTTNITSQKPLIALLPATTNCSSS